MSRLQCSTAPGGSGISQIGEIMVTVVPEEGPFVFGAYAAHLRRAAPVDQPVSTAGESDLADRQSATEEEGRQGTVETVLC